MQYIVLVVHAVAGVLRDGDLDFKRAFDYIKSDRFRRSRSVRTRDPLATSGLWAPGGGPASAGAPGFQLDGDFAAEFSSLTGSVSRGQALSRHCEPRPSLSRQQKDP